VSTSPERTRVIWNVNAGCKAGVSTNTITQDAMRALLHRFQLGDELVPTTSEAQAIASARDAVARGYERVIAAGGDGTVGTIACQLLDTETALGVLPLGSVMNIARMLEIPRELEAAAQALATGHVRPIDVGQANGRAFFECGSVGMNAAIFEQAQRFDRGEYRALLTGLWVMVRYHPARMRVRLDDQEVATRALMVTVANGPYTGLGFTVAPSARLNDGKFDVGVFRGFSKLELLRHLHSIAFGKRRFSPRVSTYRSSRVTIQSVHPLPARADAHDLGTTPVTFEVRPQALRIVVPAAQGIPQAIQQAA
jgi:diacylglycerol kinase (ATP)